VLNFEENEYWFGVVKINQYLAINNFHHALLLFVLQNVVEGVAHFLPFLPAALAGAAFLPAAFFGLRQASLPTLRALYFLLSMILNLSKSEV
jgi:hypothetical protein